MKKQKAKKAGGTKKKEDKADTPDAESSTTAEKAEDAPEPNESAVASPDPAEDDEPSELPKPTPTHGRKPSVAVESRLRSASFYRGGDGVTPTSPTPITPGGGVSSDIYREQAQRIEELERENKRLASEVEVAEGRWKKGEEELDILREGRGDIALALAKGKEADALVSSTSERFSQGHHH